MPRLTELKYRSFDDLLEDVKLEFRSFALSGKIDPAPLIKEARRINYDLGLRINQQKEAVLSVENNKARLPDNFYVLNFATLCGEFTTTEVLPQGTNVWDVVPKYTTFPNTVNPCTDVEPNACGKLPDSTKPVCLTECGKDIQLIQKINTQTRTYSHFFPLKIVEGKGVDCKCPNIRFRSPDYAWIKDGFLFTNFDCGNVYISYEATLEDEQGNLLVLDHPMINTFYEDSLKVKILQGVFFEGDVQFEKMLQLAQVNLRASRNYALSIVNTPDFAEMRATRDLNRKAMYGRYYTMFSSYPWGFSQEVYNG